MSDFPIYTMAYVAAVIAGLVALSWANQRHQARAWRSATQQAARAVYGTGTRGTGDLAGWHFLVRTCRSESGDWIALAKRGPFLAGGSVYEPGEVRFEYGATEEEARARIEAEVRTLASESVTGGAA